MKITGRNATMTFNGQTIDISGVSFTPIEKVEENKPIEACGSASGTLTMDNKSKRRLLRFIRKIYLRDLLNTFRWFRKESSK